MVEEGRKVYIHLNYTLDAASWQQQYKVGYVPGKTPYEYHQAETWGYRLTFSSSHKESKLVSVIRRAGGRLMGFDLWHAWRNRKHLSEVEAIWARPEQQYLAILLLRKLRISSPSIPLLAESIWLFDIWEKLPWWKQKLYRWLIQNDTRTVLIVQSDENWRVARALFPSTRSELIRFGISLDSFPLKLPTFAYTQGTRPLRLLSLGNDMHRDWETLLRAVEGNNNVELRIATDPSSRWNHSLKRLAYNPNQITIEPLRSLERIHDAYEWADIVVVPLTPNRHNSGITVILEAVTAGKPVIAANAGGLKGYFGDDEIRYVPPGNVEALAVAVEECTRKVDDTLARVKNAQAKLLAAGLTTKARVSSHISLTEELLS